MPTQPGTTPAGAASPAAPTLTVGAFFDQLSGEYDTTIQRTIPPYQEIFEAVTGYCFINPNAAINILELGCGTGNLSLWVSSVFPKAHMTLVDLSPEMLHQTARKLDTQSSRYTLLEGGFMDVDFPPGNFDLVVSSIALHHLLDNEKEALYPRIFSWLKPGGLFRCADEVLTLPYAGKSEGKNLKRWQEWAREHGATEAELEMWIDHAEKYDHYASLHDHFKWLEKAGFTEIDCYWKQVLWAVFGARKPD